MAVHAVVEQLRDLAVDPQNREKIVQDQGCLPGLVLFLDHNDINIVITALEALRYLVDSPSNRPIMKRELGMLYSLESIIHKSNQNYRAKSLARQVYQKLTSTCNPSPLKESQNTTQNLPVFTGRKNQQRRRSTGFFLGTHNKKSKVVTLQIEGLIDQLCRRSCEEQLLQVKGVISFTFDMVNKRCILRTRPDIQPEVLVTAIHKTQMMTAAQVLKNEHGEEIMLTFGPNPETADKENSHLPDYLPEEDSPMRSNEKALTRPGELEEERSSGSWLSTAAAFISNSFYW